MSLQSDLPLPPARLLFEEARSVSVVANAGASDLFHQRPAVEHDSSAADSDLAIVHDMARCCAVGSVIGVVVVGMIVAAVIVCNVRMRHEGDGSVPVGACRNMPLALI